jgi:triosephosphate isomerase
VIEPGYEPPIHDFSIELLDINNQNVNKNDAESDSLETDNNDITDQVLSDKGYTFLFISPWLEKAEDKDFGLINQIYEYCKNNGYAFYCLTSSSEKAIQRWIDITGAEYPFAMTDGTTLKTVIRSNPGLLLLKNGMVIRKWSHNNLPDDKMLNSKLESSDFGKLPADETGSKLLRITLLFFLPLAFLTLLDRMWAGIKWLWKRRTNKQ